MQGQTSRSIEPSGNGHGLLRLVWMGGLPIILLLIALVAVQDTWTFGGRDIALVILVPVAIAARAADALWFGGTTADGDPSTRAHVIGYAVRVVLLASVGWALAQSVAI